MSKTTTLLLANGSGVYITHPMNSRDYLTSWFLLGLFVFTHLAGAEPVFKVGSAKKDITPTEPVPMWGYGARHDLLSQGTLDPLHASAVVIQAGADKLAIVGLDLGRSPSEQSLQIIRQRIKAEAGISHSFIAGSHTHHGPVLELSNEPGKGKGRFDSAIRYYKTLEDSIVGAILEADRARVPAKMASGTINLDGFNRNRQTKLTPKAVDPTLSVLRFDATATTKPIALVVNFTGHPTSVPGEILKFSADYVGSMKGTIEKEFGGTAIFMQGASGDISVNRGTNADYIAFGQTLGREAIKLASSLQPTNVATPSLKVREDRFTFSSRSDLNNPVIRAAYAFAFFPELVANFTEEYATGVRPRITVALLNDEVGLVGGSGEFFCQHANRLRDRARLKQLFFFGYCNGYHQYFPTIEAAAEGGYGADNRVAPAEVGAGEQLMDTSLKWLYQMQNKF